MADFLIGASIGFGINAIIAYCVNDFINMRLFIIIASVSINSLVLYRISKLNKKINSKQSKGETI